MSTPGAGEGARVVARALKEQGIQYCFGIVGVPVIEVGFAMQAEGITYIAMRNEQAASYAAGAVGFLTGHPGASLAVSGPGHIHALAGLANAKENCWPMILVSGSNDQGQDGMMAFQEERQVEIARPFCKFAARPPSLERFPFFVERAVRTAISGRPGPVYVDLPGDMVNATPNTARLIYPPKPSPPPISLANPAEVSEAAELLREAKRPLVIVGKGMAYGRAEQQVRELIDRHNLRFISTPMGKGVVPDTHPSNVIAARSAALMEADVVLLLGARLNWILHFGLPPRYAKDAKFIQVDILPEELGNNRAGVRLCGSGTAVVSQLNTALGTWSHPSDCAWYAQLSSKIQSSKEAMQKLMNDEAVPMSYYRAFRDIQALAPPDAIIVSEGANTMDIGRGILDNVLPRHRLDAGSYGTMGVGLAQAIAAQVVFPAKRVICIEGDSAIGFSIGELETMCRYKLPITVIVINNSGIGVGRPIRGSTSEQLLKGAPVTSLSKQADYHKVMEAFGGRGFKVSQPAELADVLKKVYADRDMPTLVNIIISPFSNRKQQSFDWLTRESPESKL